MQSTAQGQSTASKHSYSQKNEKKQSQAEKNLAAKFDSMMESNKTLAAEIKAMTAERKKQQGPTIKLAVFSGECAMGSLIINNLNYEYLGINFFENCPENWKKTG